jgi:hypothetical protein
MKDSRLKLITIISLVSTFILVFVRAYYRKLNLEYLPYDGDFQTFNPLRRIFLGELPSRDFNPYLGLGLTYINAFFTYIFGANFAASKFSTYFLSVTAHFWSLILLFSLVGFKLRRSILLASFCLITIFLDRQHIILFWEIIEPSRSNLSLRSFLPFLTATCLLIFYSDRAGDRPVRLYFLSGFLIALQPFWSNDYGIPSTITLIFIIILDLLKSSQQQKRLKFIYLISTIFTIFCLSLYILTAGTPVNWFRDNFQGIAADQFWYFLWYDGKNKVFSLGDVFNSPFFYIYFAAIIWILRYILYKKYLTKYLLLIYLCLTVMGAGILASVGGTISIRYYTPSLLLSFFILPLAVYLFLQEYFPTSIDLWQFKLKQLKLSSRLTPLCLAIYYLLVSIFSLINMPDLTKFIFHRENFFWVEELGGWLAKPWQNSVEIARNIDRELATEPATKRILSTYSSGMDVIAKAINPTQIDYIIHTLGSRSRSKYLEKYRESQPKYITTLREEYRSWETWMRRTNWWFYREFVLHYQPVTATFYNLIWRRLEKPIAFQDYPISCSIIPQDDRQTVLKITSKTQGEIYYLDVAIEYNLTVIPSFLPIIGKRGLINITEKQTAFNKAIGQKNNRSYGIPPQAEIWYIPVEHRLGTTSILELNSYPQKRTKLTVKSCRSKLFAPLSHFTLN